MAVVWRKAGEGRARRVLVEKLDPIQAIIGQPSNEIFRHLTRLRHTETAA